MNGGDIVYTISQDRLVFLIIENVIGEYKMFEHKRPIGIYEQKKTIGAITIRSVSFDPVILQEKLLEEIFNQENLLYMFQHDCHGDLEEDLRSIYDRFIPELTSTETLDEYINRMKKNSFYSFLAEAILTIVYRDLYNYELARALYTVDEAVTLTGQGVDSCLYNEENNVIVLGEGKFYGDCDRGINKIIQNFTVDNVRNKLEHLYKISKNNRSTRTILLKNLKTNEVENVSIDRFLDNKMVFAGFVLHSENNIGIYNANYYKKFKISEQDIVSNIEQELKIKLPNADYEVLIVHLPIASKKNLIKKVICKAREERRNLNA